MFSSILSLIASCVSFVFGIFVQMLTRFDAIGIFLGVFSALTAARFLLTPLMGGPSVRGGSARSRREKDGDSD